MDIYIRYISIYLFDSLIINSRIQFFFFSHHCLKMFSMSTISMFWQSIITQMRINMMMMMMKKKTKKSWMNNFQMLKNKINHQLKLKKK